MKKLEPIAVKPYNCWGVRNETVMCNQTQAWIIHPESDSYSGLVNPQGFCVRLVEGLPNCHMVTKMCLLMLLWYPLTPGSDKWNEMRWMVLKATFMLYWIYWTSHIVHNHNSIAIEWTNFHQIVIMLILEICKFTYQCFCCFPQLIPVMHYVSGLRVRSLYISIIVHKLMI